MKSSANADPTKRAGDKQIDRWCREEESNLPTYGFSRTYLSRPQGRRTGNASDGHRAPSQIAAAAYPQRARSHCSQLVFQKMPPDWRLQVVDSNWPDRLERSTQPTPDSRSQDSNHRQKGTNHGRYGRSELPPRRITHANHPRSLCLVRIFQCLAVPRQPLKLLETLEIRVLKSLMLPVRTGSISASFNKPYAECD